MICISLCPHCDPELASTSARKSEFDLAQLQYIQAQRSADLSDPVKKAISKAQTSVVEVAKFLTDNKMDGQYVSASPLFIL